MWEFTRNSNIWKRKVPQKASLIQLIALKCSIHLTKHFGGNLWKKYCSRMKGFDRHYQKYGLLWTERNGSVLNCLIKRLNPSLLNLMRRELTKGRNISLLNWKDRSLHLRTWLLLSHKSDINYNKKFLESVTTQLLQRICLRKLSLCLVKGSQPLKREMKQLMSLIQMTVHRKEN